MAVAKKKLEKMVNHFENFRVGAAKNGMSLNHFNEHIRIADARAKEEAAKHRLARKARREAIDEESITANVM